MKNPWETPEGKTIWKTKSQYFTWLRGSLRRLWSDYPLRKEWKERQLRPVSPDEKAVKVFHPSTKNVGQCHYCKNWFAGSKLECDHVLPSNGCKSKEEAESFLWHCGGGNGDDWVLSCVPCHKVKTMSDSRGISFEAAAAEKKAISLCKLPIAEQKQILAKHNLPCDNAADRRKSFVTLTKRGDI